MDNFEEDSLTAGIRAFVSLLVSTSFGSIVFSIKLTASKSFIKRTV